MKEDDLLESRHCQQRSGGRPGVINFTLLGVVLLAMAIGVTWNIASSRERQPPVPVVSSTAGQAADDELHGDAYTLQDNGPRCAPRTHFRCPSLAGNTRVAAPRAWVGEPFTVDGPRPAAFSPTVVRLPSGGRDDGQA